MRNFAKCLTAVLSAFTLVYPPNCAPARNVYVQKSEGADGLNAWLELDESEHLRLALVDCRKTTRKLNVGIGLFVSDYKLVSDELERLRNRELNDKMDLVLCINRICEERTWEFLESGFGKAFFTNISIDQKRGPITAIRVLVPNESRRYGYLGDIDDVLLRVCRTTSSRSR